MTVPRGRVLVAEDDVELRAVLVGSLRSWGYRVQETGSGTGLGHLLFGTGDEPPDLLVTDDRMPGVSGMSALRAVRIQGWATPVVLVTAFPDREVEEEARELGAVVLAKPFALEELHRLVDAALG